MLSQLFSIVFSTKSRIFLGRLVALVIIAYIVLNPTKNDISLGERFFYEFFGFVFLCIAALGRMWCAVFITGRKNNEVVNVGPYSIVRNPLYVFSLFGVIGFCLVIEKPIFALAVSLLFIIYYNVIVKKEEVKLQSYFGDSYTKYMASTPRWIPKFSQYREPENVMVIPKRLRHDMLDAMWFIWLYLLWEGVKIFWQTETFQNLQIQIQNLF